MPKLTPNDLDKFNKGQAPEDKIYVKIQDSGSRIEVGYCGRDGNIIRNISHPSIKKYYGHDPIIQEPEDKNPLKISKYLSEKETMPYGKINMFTSGGEGEGPCLDAYITGTSHTSDKWGVLLYELLIFLAHKNGLTPDRGLVSARASNVWVKMLERSGKDIIAKRLDPIRREGDIGKITPDYIEDDCVSLHIKNDYWNSDIKNPEKAPSIMDAVNHVYYDNGLTVMDDLESLGLIWNESQKNITEHLKYLYKNILRR